VQEACNTLIIKSWELLQDPDLDALTCAFQTADIQDVAKREELKSLCITDMGKFSKDPSKRLAAAHSLGAFHKSEIFQEVKGIFYTTEDPVKINRKLGTLWYEKSLPFVIGLTQSEYKITNPAAKKIEKVKKE
jgi:hypothetical protein